MMDLSLAGLIGAVIGTIVAALAYVPLLTFVERGLRSRVSAGSADERESFEQEASLLRWAVLAVDIIVFAGIGYWLGAVIAGIQACGGGTQRSKGLRHENGSSGPLVVPQRVRGGVRARPAVLLQAQAHAQLSVRERAALAALSRRARAAPLSQRRGALHRLQALRGDLSSAGDRHRGGAAAQ